MPTKLPIIADKSLVLYFVTIFDFPHATVRHQIPVTDPATPIGEGTMVEQVTTFENWVELIGAAGAVKTGMSFGVVPNAHGQIALAALKGEIAQKSR